MTQASSVRVTVNGCVLAVPEGITLAAALVQHGVPARRSVRGELRAPVCGMGICQECRVTVNGTPHVRACLVEVRDGMMVQTGEPE